jgi:hypothetical protein
VYGLHGLVMSGSSGGILFCGVRGKIFPTPMSAMVLGSVNYASRILGSCKPEIKSDYDLPHTLRFIETGSIVAHSSIFSSALSLCA